MKRYGKNAWRDNLERKNLAFSITHWQTDKLVNLQAACGIAGLNTMNQVSAWNKVHDDGKSVSQDVTQLSVEHRDHYHFHKHPVLDPTLRPLGPFLFY